MCLRSKIWSWCMLLFHYSIISCLLGLILILNLKLMLTLIPSRLFQTQLVEDPAGSSKESTSFSLSFSMFHQNFTELEFLKILFHLLLLFFRTSKFKTWKTHKGRQNNKKQEPRNQGTSLSLQAKKAAESLEIAVEQGKTKAIAKVTFLIKIAASSWISAWLQLFFSVVYFFFDHKNIDFAALLLTIALATTSRRLLRSSPRINKIFFRGLWNEIRSKTLLRWLLKYLS